MSTLRKRRDETEWCILRCSNAKTMDLAASLTDAGLDAWSPVETVQRRSRAGGKPEAVKVPLTPSFVFAPAKHLHELLALSHSPSLNYQVWDSEQRRMVTKGHPYFRVFHYLNDIATIPDRQLSALRELERKRTPAPEGKVMPKGERVRLKEAGFEGLWATVQSSRKTYTRVLIDGWIVPVDLPTWTLQNDTCNENEPGLRNDKALSAKAA